MIKINPRDICMADAMPFQQHHEARTVATFEQLCTELTPKTFVGLANLRVGDSIIVAAFENNKWEVMTGIAEVRVVRVPKARDRCDIKVMRLAEIEPPKLDPTIQPPRKEFLVKKEGKDWVVMEKGTTKAVEVFTTKKAADEFCSSIS